MCLNESQKPRERLSLSLSARLINGVIKILFQQTRILQGIYAHNISCAYRKILTLFLSFFRSPFPVLDSTYNFTYVSVCSEYIPLN